MKRAVIIGASSGIGREVSKLLIQVGYRVGLAARRVELLEEIQAQNPSDVVVCRLDVTSGNADEVLLSLIEEVGGMDLFFLASGVGGQNRDLKLDLEKEMLNINVLGFTSMVTTAFNYFKKVGNGHIAVISSIAGTKGMGTAAAYSSSKRFQNTYIQSLVQLACMENIKIKFTDIKPGFVDTALLNDKYHYPMKMDTKYVAKKIIKAIFKRRRSIVIDWKYSLLVFLWQMIPNWMWERMRIRN